MAGDRRQPHHTARGDRAERHPLPVRAGDHGNLYSRTTARHYDPRLGEYSYTWNAWERRTTDTLNSAPSAASFRNDQAQAWYIRADLHPYQVWWSGTTQAWAGPAQPGGSVGNLTGALGIMQWSDNFEVYGRGTDRKVWFKWYRSVWSNWIQQSTLGTVNSSVAATLYGGNTNLFARGPSGNVVWSPYAAGWQPWTSLGGVIL